MIRSLILLCGLAVLGALAYMQLPRTTMLTAQGATAQQMGDGPMYMVGLDVENTGDPQVLVSVTSPGAEMAQVMGSTGPVIIPGGASGSFAMDGAHIMLRRAEGEAAGDGGFLPLTLTFDSGDVITTRATIETGMMMDHSLARGVSEDPAPRLDVQLDQVDRDGATITLELEDLTLVRKEDPAAHVPGEGHAHVYLNGLKLGRLYDRDFQTGALPQGTHRLRVTLNTNDHRPYLASGKHISAALAITVE